MKKLLVLLALINNLSNAIEIEGRLRSGFSAAWGGEAIEKPFSKLTEMLVISLPRENIFGETFPVIPDFSGTETNSSNNSASSNESKEDKVEPIYVKNQDEADREFSKRYVSRQVLFDKTLLDAKLKIKDFNTETGLVIKARPHRYDQGFSLFDINRAYMYANVDLDRFKLNSTLYFKGYENGTPGLNKYSEGGYRDPKLTGQLDVDVRTTPIKFYISPDVSFKYMGNIKNTQDYGARGGIQGRFIDNDKHFVGLSLSYEIGKNKEKDALIYFLEDIPKFAFGNREIEYFKNWELGEKILDRSYNRDGYLKDKDGKIAYRIIGRRDIEKAHLSGLNGSIRVVGSPTGALFGKTLVKRAMEEVVSIIDDNIRDSETIINTITDKKIDIRVLKQIFKPTIKEDIENIINNKDEKMDKILEKAIRNVMKEINVPIDKPVSDFYITHLIPREYRDFFPNILPEIPYEDSYANRKYRDKEKPLPDIIIKAEAGNGNSNPPTVGISFNINEVNFDKYGSNAVKDEMIYVPEDSRNAILKTEFKDSIEKFASISRRSKQKLNFSRFINHFQDGVSIFRDLIKDGKLSDLIFSPEILEAFDMFSNLQFNQSESEYRQYFYKKQLYDVLSDNIAAYNGDKKFQINKDNDKVYHGYHLNFEYKNKKNPIYLIFNSFSHKVNANREIIKVDKTVLAKNVHYYEPYMYQIGPRVFPKRNFSDWISDDTNITEKENILNLDNSLKLGYKGESLNLNSSLDVNYKKINFESLRNEKLKYAMFNHVGRLGVIKRGRTELELDFISKANLSYSKLTLNPKFNVSYHFKPSKYFEIKPEISYEGKYVKNIYDGFKFARYLKQEEGSDKSNLKEIEIEIFKRDDKNRLIKAQGAPSSKSEYFNNLKAGDSVELDKISKYAIDEVERAFEKEKISGGNSNWESPISEVSLDLNVSVIPIKQLSLDYELNIPVIFKGKNLHAFYIKNGLNLSFRF